MADSGKRKAESNEGQAKRVKYSKFKTTNRGNDNTLAALKAIEPGHAGIWATCVRGLEGKATAQLRQLLDEYAVKLYPDLFPDRDGADAKTKLDDDEDDDEGVDIEAAIKSELKEAKTASKKQIFKTVRIDIACVLFFKVDAPMDPIAIVQRLCEDAAGGQTSTRTRHINRLTPMTLFDKASPEGLTKVCQKVLAPHFHGDAITSKSFAVRPTIRNHNVMSRMQVIDQVAEFVGKSHTVDLSNPDLVVLVDVYANVCGMSVVDGNHEKKLKRYNLNEIFGSIKGTKDGREIRNPDSPAKNVQSATDAPREQEAK